MPALLTVYGKEVRPNGVELLLLLLLVNTGYLANAFFHRAAPRPWTSLRKGKANKPQKTITASRAASAWIATSQAHLHGLSSRIHGGSSYTSVRGVREYEERRTRKCLHCSFMDRRRPRPTATLGATDAGTQAEDFQRLTERLSDIPDEERTVDAAAARVIRQAKAWVRDVVIRLQLCPFAEGVFKAEKGVRYVVSSAENSDSLFKDFLAEVGHLMLHTREEVGTTLLMAPRCLSDLQEWNDFCQWLEETIENDEVLVDQVLAACFHPKHAFHGLSEDDVLNYEKRSPHPTINLLRADVVDEYIAAAKTLGIAEHNEKMLHGEGRDAVRAAFEATLAVE